MGDSRRHRFLAERVYNDLSSLVCLLETLDVLPKEYPRLTSMGGVSYAFTIQLVAARFTRTANEKQYEESLPLRL